MPRPPEVMSIYDVYQSYGGYSEQDSFSHYVVLVSTRLHAGVETTLCGKPTTARHVVTMGGHLDIECEDCKAIFAVLRAAYFEDHPE